MKTHENSRMGPSAHVERLVDGVLLSAPGAALCGAFPGREAMGPIASRSHRGGPPSGR